MDNNPYIKFKNVYIIPTFHSRIEFTKLVRTAFFKVFPDVIAVELPSNVKEEILEAIERLPFLSLIGYADTLNPDKLNFIPIDPGDSIIESIRIGLEYNTPIEFIDLSVTEYLPPTVKLPDDYAINQIGLSEFHQKISEFFDKNYSKKKKGIRGKVNLEDFLKNQENHKKEYDVIEKDVLREKFMAAHLLKLMTLYHRVLFVVGMAHWDNIKYYLENPKEIRDVELDLIPHQYVKIYNVKGSDARFLLRELPYHTYKWLKFRKRYSKESLEKLEKPEDLYNILNSYKKIEHISKILLKSKYEYEEEFKEFVDLHKLKDLFQYLRNLSLMEQRLLPNLYQFLIASKNVVDDDYAWKVMDNATKYPYSDDSNKYETLKMGIEGGYDPNGRYIKLRRHHPYTYGKEKEVPLKKRPEEKYPGEWRNEWEEQKDFTVSFPPEDIIEEDYFAYIRKKSIKNLKNQRVRIEEFKSSLLDGIAIKETIRNWAFKKKIFVRHIQQIHGKIDTIVVIFDKDDEEKEKYPYKLTWWAEHDRESDMAFYSTFPGAFLVGPGISHVEVGGLLSIFPAIFLRSIFDPYMNYEYKDTKNKAERLLKAAILYSKERYIAYIAEIPPRKYFYSLAGIKNRELLYIPLDNFSNESLKTIKHIHILAGRDKRKIAHNYIFLNK
ncbi:hypothetical protein LCGC14_0832840 [marine sediment metagenome]|uniref:TraB determinant protein n=1 Tax=marine sediment metagenome TaxID=412755 RepID=A0A0F9PK54_9ZZZZ